MEAHLRKLDETQMEIWKLEKEIKPIQNKINNLQEFYRLVEKKAEELVRADEVNSSTIRSLEEAGAEYIYIDLENADTLRNVCEDDGTLHITFGKVRGCFICNQDIKKSDWNILAKEILKKFNFPFSELKNKYDK